MYNPKPIHLRTCPKKWRQDLDKAISPEETIRLVSQRLSQIDLDIVAEIRRIDTGRLGIPVYLGICGSDARKIMPTRKQMGKGSSPDQARASALMELMERYAFFSFWNREDQFVKTCWSQAKKLFGEDLLAESEILRSVRDELPPETAAAILDLCHWRFYPATRLHDEKTVWLPLDWFRMLGEFNGSSAGNTQEESIFQGIGELVERHVCCLADAAHPFLPTIDPGTCNDPKLAELLEAFRTAGVQLILKDMSMDMPIPTVAALAWDPATFPHMSEIVFTAGTAASPAKAAIRAITEVAQLGGDFHTNSCYEASGLSKYASLEECAWLMQGPVTSLAEMPSVEQDDILEELRSCLYGLSPVMAYAVETTDPLLGIPAHYCLAPGLQFRERARNQCLGLFVGRKLVEDFPFREAMDGLSKLGKLLPGAPWLTFFQGLAHLNHGLAENAHALFTAAIPLQTDSESRAMAEFYAAYALTMNDSWQDAIPYLQEAVCHSGEVKEYHNLLGVAMFRTGRIEEAEAAFSNALKLDKGSAMDLANRGICRKLRGDRQGAMEDLQASLELDPSLDFAYSHLEELQER